MAAKGVHTMSRWVPDKWLKTNALLKHQGIARHIPETRRFTGRQLARMLNKYGRVVIKPSTGTGGHGVILIYKQGTDYVIHHKQTVKRKRSFTAMLTEINRLRHGRAYLVQKGIHLAQIAGRPIDYRVKLVVRNGRWTTSYIKGKWAKPGLIVTNICQGGTLLRARDAIRRSLSIAPGKKVRKLRALSYQGMRVLASAFPGIDKLGFDYGIDTKGKIWLLEVNTKPS